jgi:hypothetical protein
MNKIKNDVDVLDWAKMISDGKGEKFIPLGKSDMYAIADFILRNAKFLDRAPLADPKPEQEEPSLDKAVGVVSEYSDPIEVEQPAKETFPTTSTSGNPATTQVTMTRGYALHRAGLSTQAAYDKFLEWSKEHPKEGTVMDFSTGVKSANAAFAYWLMENIVVEVPTSETTTRW